MTDIHSTAIVSPKARIADNVTIGPYAIVEDDVVIGEGCRIGPSALLASGTRLGREVQVFKGAVIGERPQDLKFGGEPTTAEIGDHSIIREYATIHRGTTYHHRTVVGQHCFIMAYAHVAHDCIVGDHVILANSVNLAGHVEIEDYVVIGGVVPVHQFVRIGAHSMIGGGFRVQQDICPFALAGGYPLEVKGLNVVGLRRRGFSREVIRTLQRTFKLLFFSNLNTTQAVERIRAEIDPIPEVQTILEFIEKSKRGLVK